LAFFNAKNQVIFHDDTGSKSAASNKILLGPNNGVVIGVAELFVLAAKAQVIGRDVNELIWHVDFIFYLSPVLEAWHAFERFCPLTS